MHLIIPENETKKEMYNEVSFPGLKNWPFVVY